MKVQEGGFLMDGEQIFGIIIICFISLICGAVFYGLGVYAKLSKQPMHFYSGTVVDPKTISDIPAYNRANEKMWKQYSIPYWLTFVSGILTIFDARFSVMSGILIFLACTFGIGWLIWKYNSICKRYQKGRV